ncbi:hypothetical protein KSP40_PGU010654 [Platanthera guangdongensis]|uniref:Uncharacterized protein n=1 Tax=Platanthera guangdongensis TaxID=2320717 RepID=A0ABR2LSV0_9ASPA
MHLKECGHLCMKRSGDARDRRRRSLSSPQPGPGSSPHPAEEEGHDGQAGRAHQGGGGETPQSTLCIQNIVPRL